MNLIQYETESGGRAVGAVENGQGFEVLGARSVYDLAQEAIAGGKGLAELIAAKGYGPAISVGAILAEGRMLAPVDHPDPAHLYRHRHRPHPSRLGLDPRCDAQVQPAGRRGAADRLR